MNQHYTLIYYHKLSAIQCVYTLEDSNGDKQTYTSTIEDFLQRFQF